MLPCVNDVRGEARLGNVRGLSWAQVLAWKRQVISDSRWFGACSSCDDDYRWALIAQGQVDGELPPAGRSLVAHVDDLELH